jgi:hypothetical protein
LLFTHPLRKCPSLAALNQAASCLGRSPRPRNCRSRTNTRGLSFYVLGTVFELNERSGRWRPSRQAVVPVGRSQK